MLLPWPLTPVLDAAAQADCLLFEFCYLIPGCRHTAWLFPDYELPPVDRLVEFKDGLDKFTNYISVEKRNKP